MNLLFGEDNVNQETVTPLPSISEFLRGRRFGCPPRLVRIFGRFETVTEIGPLVRSGGDLRLLHRQTQKLAVSTVNSNLRVLRRVLGLAVDWGVLSAMPKMKLLRGERIRDRVVNANEEQRYLAMAPEPLASIVTILFDTGLRTDECFRLCWESISWVNGQYGTLSVTHGKSAAARRVLPMTLRVRTVLENLWLAAGKPETGYVWPGETSTGHIHDETVRRAHVKTLKVAGLRHFVLHSIRHTFLTRLGETGCDVWTLARIAGHNSIKVSSRYVHPSEDAVQVAMSRLGGHKIGHSAPKRLPPASAVSVTTAVDTTRTESAA